MKITNAKEIKKMDLLVLGVFENSPKLETKLNPSEKKLVLDYVLNEEGFKGKFDETYILNNLDGDIKKIMFVGLGKMECLTLDKIRELGANVYKKAEKIHNVKKITFEILGAQAPKANKEENARALIEGALCASYKFDKYKTKAEKSKIATIEILGDVKKVVERAVILNNSLEFAKNLINEQANVLTPLKMAEIAKEMAVENKLSIKIYEQKELEKMGMGAYLAVARGSINPPKFIHLKYSPKNAKKKIALVGKGITFDSGGLDIKPSASMMDMKDDMSGCACVLATIKAISQLKPDVEVHAISALCENMPSGKAYKQGDVLVATNNVTIEVDNTDAEGRLTLADALCFADKLNVDEIIDVATLTGACIVALGNKIAGLMGTNKKMLDELEKTASYSGEMLWQLPMTDDMMDNLKSDIADMRNTGGREAGTAVAAKFLSNFVKNKNWAHIDIAGTAHISKPYRELSKGATGSMVKTLINYICK